MRYLIVISNHINNHQYQNQNQGNYQIYLVTGVPNFFKPVEKIVNQVKHLSEKLPSCF